MLWSSAAAVRLRQPEDNEGMQHQETFCLHPKNHSPWNSSLISYGAKSLWCDLLSHHKIQDYCVCVMHRQVAAAEF